MYRDYILTVDRGNPYPHVTKGRYRVCARSKKEAFALLQAQIGFGKIELLSAQPCATLPRKKVIREVGGAFCQQRAAHACTPKEDQQARNSDRVWKRIRLAAAGSLAYYAKECRDGGDMAQARRLQELAKKIRTGKAGEDDWLEAIDELDLSD